MLASPTRHQAHDYAERIRASILSDGCITVGDPIVLP